MISFLINVAGWAIIWGSTGSLTGWQIAAIIIGVIMTGVTLPDET